MKSSHIAKMPLLIIVRLSLALTNFEGRPHQGLPINWKVMFLSPLICVYWAEIFCLKALVLSARMHVMVFQDQHTLTKWNILSNCLLIYKQRENISLWEGVMVLEDHYIHTNRENKSFETEYCCPIHTYEQRECHSYQYIHKIVQNQVSSHKPEKLVSLLVYYPDIMKTSSIRVLENFSLP